MRKLVIILFLICFSIFSFSASELDSLLQDDNETFDELTAEKEALVPKEVFVEELSGEAFVQREGSTKWLQLIEKSSIQEKDTVITMEKSSLKIRMEKEVYINIGEKTKLYFDTLKGKPESEVLIETGLKLAFGKVFSNVRKKLEIGGRYEIEAGSIVAGVRGTQYLARLNKEGEINVKVYEGRVYCRFIDEKGETIKKKKTEDAEEVSEVVLGANEEFTIVEGDTGWLKIPHSETAPIDHNKINKTSDELY